MPSLVADFRNVNVDAADRIVPGLMLLPLFTLLIRKPVDVMVPITTSQG